MATLDYQNADDERRQRRSQLWRELFGVTEEDAWKVLADEIGARHERTDALFGRRVVAQAGAWQIVLENDNRGATHMRSPYINRDGFWFRIYRAGTFTEVAKRFGLQDVQIGEPLFDGRYVIQSNNPFKIRLFLQDMRLRQLIWAYPHLMFEVKRHDRDLFIKRFPKGVDELYLVVGTAVTDLDRLRVMFALFSQALSQLHEIGSAEDYPPGVTL
jgi:hypothetical protein